MILYVGDTDMLHTGRIMEEGEEKVRSGMDKHKLCLIFLCYTSLLLCAVLACMYGKDINMYTAKTNV